MALIRKTMQIKVYNFTVWLIAITLLFPLFFQLSGGIYKEAAWVMDSGGVLDSLPLPISIVTCVIGLLVFFRNVRQAVPSILFVLAFFAVIVLSLVFSSENVDIEYRKMIFAAQTLLPTMGLVLGQLVRDEQNAIPRAFMWVLLLVVPFQLFAGVLQNTLTLTHYLYVFTIYQHFQYVPVIFVMAYCLVMVHLYESQKPLSFFLTFVMGMYVIASASFLAISLYIGFVLLFFLITILRFKTTRLNSFLIIGAGILAVALIMSLYFLAAKNNKIADGEKGVYYLKFQSLANGKMPTNVAERLSDWKMYGNWIGESKRTLVFGHVSPPPREIKTSPHNWYIDLSYNLGLLSLLPVLALIIFTALLIRRFHGALSSETWWLTGLVAFMVLVDCNFKVTLRQPYPGIFAYFLWGLLLSRLRFQPAPKLGA
ncbi:MAG: hypothetical protein H6R17_282 [Proteobacteria bacterium]|nr:hypothetical protein [Pseudomonadota bacterium]